MGTIAKLDVSCGARQMYHLTGHPPEDVQSVVDYFETYNDDTGWLVVFSDNSKRSRGEKLAEFIKINKLGKIVDIGYHMNPNTHFSYINMWIWRVNIKACKRILRRQNV